MNAAIIGCGVMGAAAARALARRGHEVSIYERFEVGHDRGSSHGASRIYRFSYPDPAYVGMMKEALELWRDLEVEANVDILQRTGGLDTGKDLDAHASALDAHDIAYEMIDRAEAADRWPGLTLPAGEALFQAGGGIVHAARAWEAFARGAVAAGASLLEHHTVQLLDPSGLPGHDVTVITAGGWARDLLATAGIALPTRATRETVAFFRTERGFPTLVDWGDPSVYCLPDPVYGLKVGEHIAGPVTDPNETGSVDLASVERLKRWVATRFATAEPDPAHAETCIYTNTTDEHFVLERHGTVVVGSACSGHGFKFAPLIGERLADLAEG